jgi:hypothetical protein
MPAWRAAHPVKDSEEVSGLLADARTEAMRLKQDAEELNGFVQSRTRWEIHAAKLNEIKEHVNELDELVTKMNSAEVAASPWQQQSIRGVTPLLVELSAAVTSTIKHLSDGKDRLLNPPYPAYAMARADYAADLAQLVSDYIACGDARRKSEDLAQKLELPGN